MHFRVFRNGDAITKFVTSEDEAKALALDGSTREVDRLRIEVTPSDSRVQMHALDYDWQRDEWIRVPLP